MNTLSRRNFLGGALAVGAAAGASGLLASCGSSASSGTSSGKAIKWRFSSSYPAGTSLSGAMDTFSKEIAERTSGRITVKTYPGEQLGGAKDLLQGVQLGRHELTMASPAWIGSVAKDFAVLNLPYLAASMESMLNGVNSDNALAKRFDASAGAVGFKSFGFLSVGARNIQNRLHQVEAVADLKGMKLRMQGDPIFLKFAEALGTKPVTMESSDMYLGLQQGSIDGQDNGLISTWSNKWWEIAKYYTLTNHVYDLQGLLMNHDAWAELSEADQAAVVDSFATTREKQIAANAQELSKALEDMKSEITVTELDASAMSEFVEVGRSIYTDFYEDLGQDLVEEALDALKEA